MPFYPPFNIPFFYNNYKYPHKSFNPKNHTPKIENHNETIKSISESNEKASENVEIPETSEAFFEIFGLKLYFDDILIMCILFFLYTEKVHDDELFICLILLLLT